MVAQPERFEVTPELLRAHATDHAWLTEHYELVCVQVQAALREGPTVRYAVTMLAAIIPYVTSREDRLRWRSPLYDALLLAMDMHDDAFQIEVWSLLGSILLRSGSHKTARAALRKALADSKSQPLAEAVLLARIGMLSLYGMYHFNDIDGFVTETLDLARRSDRLDLRARLFSNLGTAYVHRARTMESLAYMQLAYALWRTLGNAVEQRRALLVMAEACRVGNRFEESMRYLEQAGEDESDSYSTGIRRYHEGALLLARTQYEAAEQTLQQALALFDTLDYPYLTASAHHALGIAQIHCGQYDRARKHLMEALHEWERSDNQYQRVGVIHCLAYLDHMRGDYDSACIQYQDALRFLDDLPESPIVKTLRLAIQSDLADLPT